MIFYQKKNNLHAIFGQQLYGYGARRIGVIGTPPLGCTPSQRVKDKKICDEEINYAAQLFNSKLAIILDQLSETLRNSTLVYMDIYSIFSKILESPAHYGNYYCYYSYMLIIIYHHMNLKNIFACRI